MRILVNTLSVTAQRGGVRTYLCGLLEALHEVDEANTYFLLCSSTNVNLFQHLADSAKNVILCEIPWPVDGVASRLLLDQLAVPRYVRQLGVDLLVVPSNVACFARSAVPQIVILQAPLVVPKLRKRFAPPGMRSRLRSLYLALTIRPTFRRAQKIVAVSHFLASELTADAPWVEKKLVVIPEGVDPDMFRSESPEGESEEDSLLQDGYVLFVSTLFPYKNTASLLQAFSMLRTSGGLPEPARLKIVGGDPDGRQLPALQWLARRLGIYDSVDFLGSVPRERLGAMYRLARVFVYPSLMESFGLPPLEAMSCGTPVVASNRASLPEVVGEAALVVDPIDQNALAKAIQRAYWDEQLRSELRAKGYRRAQQLSWKAAAERFVELFQEVAQPPEASKD